MPSLGLKLCPYPMSRRDLAIVACRQEQLSSVGLGHDVPKIIKSSPAQNLLALGVCGARRGIVGSTTICPGVALQRWDLLASPFVLSFDGCDGNPCKLPLRSVQQKLLLGIASQTWFGKTPPERPRTSDPHGFCSSFRNSNPCELRLI